MLDGHLKGNEMLLFAEKFINHFSASSHYGGQLICDT